MVMQGGFPIAPEPLRQNAGSFNELQDRYYQRGLIEYGSSYFCDG